MGKVSVNQDTAQTAEVHVMCVCNCQFFLPPSGIAQARSKQNAHVHLLSQSLIRALCDVVRDAPNSSDIQNLKQKL